MNRLPAFIVIFLSVILNGCFGPSVSGSGHVVSETRNVSGFSSVSLEGSGRVVIEQGGAESLTVTADDNLLHYVETEVRGSTLVLGEKSGVRLSPSKDIVFKVTLRKLETLDISGSGFAEAKGLQSAKMKIDISGSGEVSAEGADDDLDINISGSGRFRGDGLKSKRTRVDISGSGSAVVASSETLNAIVSGSGSIEYVGDPQIHQNISGSGSIRKR
jgi:Putative auto-transporter adhesin, head GIN domain